MERLAVVVVVVVLRRSSSSSSSSHSSSRTKRPKIRDDLYKTLFGVLVQTQQKPMMISPSKNNASRVCVCYIFHALESSVGCARRSFIKGRQSTPHHVSSLSLSKTKREHKRKKKKGYLGSHKVLFLFLFF